jgi:hypothetical protein
MREAYHGAVCLAGTGSGDLFKLAVRLSLVDGEIGSLGALGLPKLAMRGASEANEAGFCMSSPQIRVAAFA